MGSQSSSNDAPREESPPDQALVLAARAGERWAQEAIFRRYARMVNALAGRLLGWGPDADDLVQDAFLAAFDSLPRLERPEALKSWLGGIVIRLAHKRLRRRTLLVRLGLRGGPPLDVEALVSPHAPPDVKAELKAVYAVLDQLPAEERIALVLRRIEGMDLDAISEAMGLSLATVKRRLTRADEALARWRSVSSRDP